MSSKTVAFLNSGGGSKRGEKQPHFSGFLFTKLRIPFPGHPGVYYVKIQPQMPGVEKGWPKKFWYRLLVPEDGVIGLCAI